MALELRQNGNISFAQPGMSMGGPLDFFADIVSDIACNAVAELAADCLVSSYAVNAGATTNLDRMGGSGSNQINTGGSGSNKTDSKSGKSENENRSGWNCDNLTEKCMVVPDLDDNRKLTELAKICGWENIGNRFKNKYFDSYFLKPDRSHKSGDKNGPTSVHFEFEIEDKDVKKNRVGDIRADGTPFHTDKTPGRKGYDAVREGHINKAQRALSNLMEKCVKNPENFFKKWNS